MFLAMTRTNFTKLKQPCSGISKRRRRSWSGTLDENKKADRRVGEKIFKSFKAYERNKKDGAPEYFSFKK